MSIKQRGGVFGRNPKFNSVEVESLSIAGNAVPDASTILVDGDIGSTVQGYDADTAKLDVAQTFTAAQTFNENIVMANTKGIDFSATAGTGTSELFNDYEEGTFTPVVADAATGGNTATLHGSSTANYAKIGRLVYVSIYTRDINTTGMTAGNTAFFRGLPFASGDVAELYFDIQYASGVTRTSTWAYLANGSSAAAASFTIGDISSGTADVRFSFSYLAS